MTFKIEKLPIPPKHKTKPEVQEIIDCCNKLKKNECFTVEYGDGRVKTNVNSAIVLARQRHPKKEYLTRNLGTGLRIWRIK